MKLPSYPKVFNLGHPAIEALLDGPVVVQEKIDGSQFSFGLIDGELHFRSRQQEVHAGQPGMFEAATSQLVGLKTSLVPGWIYRGEYLQKPKHNVLAYERVPRRNVILFDVEIAPHSFLDPDSLEDVAEILELDVVPFLGTTTDGLCLEHLTEMLERVSCLGGQKIEGVVIKGYDRFGKDGKTLMGKHVSEAFKEVHRADWKGRNPSHSDILEMLGQRYRSEARWAKAVQRLRDQGRWQCAPQDIGALMREVQQDIHAECEEEIKAALFSWAWKQFCRRTTAGLPEWYKQLLVLKQFEEKE